MVAMPPVMSKMAAFEMAEAAGIGVSLTASATPALFGEDQARYLLAVPQESLAGLQAAAKVAGVHLALVGPHTRYYRNEELVS